MKYGALFTPVKDKHVYKTDLMINKYGNVRTNQSL